MSDNEKTYQVIACLRFPLILAVIYIHSFSKSYDINTLHDSGLNAETIYIWGGILLSHVLCHGAVPVFFVISGYLFFNNMKEWKLEMYVMKMKRRIYSLVIPYFFWNVLYMLFMISTKHMTFEEIQDLGLSVFWNCNTWGENRMSIFGFPMPMSSPILVPLWYLRDLFVVSVCAPIIYYAIKRFNRTFILLLLIAYILKIFIPISGFTTTAFLFFSLGTYLALSNRTLSDLKVFRKSTVLTSFIILPVVVYYDGWSGNFYIQTLFLIFIFVEVLAILSCADLLYDKGLLLRNTFLAKGSFFVYLSHIFILGFFFKHIPQLLPNALNYEITVYLLAPICCALTCYLIYWCMNKYLRFLIFTVGGR